MNSQLNSMLRGWRLDAAALLACALVTLLMYVVLIRPVVNAQNEYARLLPERSEKEQTLRTAQASLNTMREQLESAREQVEQLPLRLESSAQVNTRLARLAEMAAEAGLELHEMRPSEVWAGDRYDTVPIVLSGSGNYRNVTTFMRNVHEQFADTAVVGFDLSSGGATKGQATFGVGLAWYTMPAMGFVEN